MSCRPSCARQARQLGVLDLTAPFISLCAVILLSRSRTPSMPQGTGLGLLALTVLLSYGVTSVAAGAPCGATVLELASQLKATRFVQLVKTAGLDKSLDIPASPCTILIPTNAAIEKTFKAYPDLSSDELKSILSYHVVPFKEVTVKLAKRRVPTRLDSQTIFCAQGTNDFIVQGYSTSAKLVQKDKCACNNKVNVNIIDKVLIPALPRYKKQKKTYRPPVDDAQCASISTLLSSYPQFSYFVQAAKLCGVYQNLDRPAGNGATVFAPTNDAFIAYASSLRITVSQLMSQTVYLRQLMNYHVVPGLCLTYDSLELYGSSLPTSYGTQTISVSYGGSLTLSGKKGNRCRVVKSDIRFCKLIVHAINVILVPPIIVPPVFKFSPPPTAFPPPPVASPPPPVASPPPPVASPPPPKVAELLPSPNPPPPEQKPPPPDQKPPPPPVDPGVPTDLPASLWQS